MTRDSKPTVRKGNIMQMIENQNSIPIYTDRYQTPTRENNSVRATLRILKYVNIPALLISLRNIKITRL